MHFSCMMLCQETWEAFLPGVWGFQCLTNTHTHTPPHKDRACLCVMVTAGFVNKQSKLPQLYFVTISMLGVNLSRAE